MKNNKPTCPNLLLNALNSRRCSTCCLRILRLNLGSNRSQHQVVERMKEPCQALTLMNPAQLMRTLNAHHQKGRLIQIRKQVRRRSWASWKTLNTSNRKMKNSICLCARRSLVILIRVPINNSLYLPSWGQTPRHQTQVQRTWRHPTAKRIFKRR